MRSGHDYVIVGAGSAGCVLADRLSEDPGCRVLLLEAGPPDTARQIRIPSAMPTLFGGPYDWDYTTVAQPHAAGRTVRWPSGRTLGGSSATNAMIYIRGSKKDFDSWRDEYGCTGWSYADLLPYFGKAEERLRIVPARQRHQLTRAWVQAAQASGLPAVEDFNAGDQDGVGFYRLTQRRGRRWSTSDAYLRPAMRRDNLTVTTGALVTGVLMDGTRAVGVRFLRHGTEHQDLADVEVILCAGAIRSPQLLMLSGIGPADQLEEHGIEVAVVADRIGDGLQDHPRCTATWQPSGAHPARAATFRWRLLGRGPLASNGGESGGFARTRAGLAAPDLQYHIVPPGIEAGGPVSVLVTAVEVGSRGSIRLRSADPTEPPMIDPAYLADDADLDVLVAGVRQAREIASHPPFADLAPEELTPGPAVSDDRLRSWVRQNVVTMHHPTSTCAMGGTPTSACDLQLRVRGVTGLRVVDASVMPAVPRGNTNAPTIAIAERAADLIRRRER